MHDELYNSSDLERILFRVTRSTKRAAPLMLAQLEREPAASRWASRAALFAFGLVAAAMFLHRVVGMATPVAFNLLVVAMGVALLSILLAIAASFVIWRSGRPGTARVLFAVTLSLALIAAPIVGLAWLREHPIVSDITTNFENPPRFSAVLHHRGPGSNAPAYDRARSAEEQVRAYPDIRPLRIHRSSEEVYAVVVDAVKRLKLLLEREDPPNLETGTPGMVEAVDRSLIMGLYDDIAIRVSGTAETARVDIRSAARFGHGVDMGRNAERVRALMQEIQLRIEALVPAAADADGASGTRQERANRSASARRRK